MGREDPSGRTNSCPGQGTPRNQRRTCFPRNLRWPDQGRPSLDGTRKLKGCGSIPRSQALVRYGAGFPPGSESRASKAIVTIRTNYTNHITNKEKWGGSFGEVRYVPAAPQRQISIVGIRN